MKIAVVCPIGLSVVRFCKGIITNFNSIPDSEVHVLCDMGDYQKEIEALGVVVVPLKIYRFASPKKDFKYTWDLYRHFRSVKYDVVFNFATKPNIYGTIAAKLAGIPFIVFHVVGRGTAFEERSDYAGALLKNVVILLYRLAGKWCHKAWFTNGSDLEYFIRQKIIQKNKTEISKNYFNIENYSASDIGSDRMERAHDLCGLKEGEAAIVMVARMIWAKGIREFADAAISMKSSHPDLKFVLVAPLEDGSYGSVPESFVKEVERTSNFIWLGFQEDVIPLYAIAQVAVLPSYYLEGGYPRALLEPMAMGKPLVTTDTDGCRGAVENGSNGFLVPPP